MVQESPNEQTTTQNKQTNKQKTRKTQVFSFGLFYPNLANCASVCLTQGVKLIQVKSLIELQSMFKPKTDKILANLSNLAGLVS